MRTKKATKKPVKRKAKARKGKPRKKTRAKGSTKPNGKGTGRDTKFTRATCSKILRALRRGHYLETACRLAGITRQCFYQWRDKAKDGEKQFVDFFDEVEKAEAVAEDTALKTVQDEVEDGNASTALEFLRRRYPDRWGNKDHLSLHHKGGIKTEHSYEDLKGLLADKRFRALAGRFLSRLGATSS